MCSFKASSVSLIKYSFMSHFTEVTAHFYYEYFESFSGISDTPISLRLVSGDTFCSFYWTMFPSVFFFLDTLCWRLNIGKNYYLPRLYRLDSCGGRSSPVSLARDSGDPSHFSCGCVFSELVYVILEGFAIFLRSS